MAVLSFFMNDSPADELERELESMGIEKSTIYDPLFEIYCCGGKIAYQRGTPLEDGDGNIIRGGNKLWDHPSVALLKDLGLIESVATGGRQNRVYSYVLTDRAKAVGGQISQGRINEQRRDIERILADFSDEFLRIVSMSGGRYGRRKRGTTESVTIPISDYTSSRDEHWVAALASELRSIETRQVSDIASREELESLVGSDSKRDEMLDVARKHERGLANKFDDLFASLMLRVPAFHGQATSLFERLEEVGLAYRDKVFSTTGKSSSTYWRAPYELTLVIDSPPLTEQVSQFSALYPLLKAVGGSESSSYTRAELEIDLQRLEHKNENVAIESLRDRLAELHERGLTSKLNEAGEGSRPAFLVLNREGLTDYLKHEITSIVTPMLDP